MFTFGICNFRHIRFHVRILVMRITVEVVFILFCSATDNQFNLIISKCLSYIALNSLQGIATTSYISSEVLFKFKQAQFKMPGFQGTTTWCHES